ncbi:MAG TPA: DinB family protein, partial [Pyrinomonadaceae bacterium]
TVKFFENIPAEKVDYRYAEGKWTVKEVLMHLIDTERVFAYRALTAARGDGAPHYRMDEELYAGNVDVTHRALASLLAEFKAVRNATTQFFENLTEAQSKWTCNIVPHPMSARAIGYFLIAHVRHHRNVIEERYL